MQIFGSLLLYIVTMSFLVFVSYEIVYFYVVKPNMNEQNKYQKKYIYLGYKCFWKSQA